MEADARLSGRLAQAGCVAAVEEAAEMLAARPGAATLERWVRRREQGEPLAWIIGTTRFCGHTIHVEPGVYVPRAQTEVLARRAARLLPPGGRAVDLCTGAGAVAVHLAAAVPTAAVVGVDNDRRAVACARRNQVVVLAGDLDRAVRAPGRLDVVTAVAPYVPTAEMAFLPRDVQRYEPRSSLDGGDGGLDVLARVVAAGGRLLRPGGWLLIEVGGSQDVALAGALAAAGFTVVSPWYDDEGDLRGLAARCGARAGHGGDQVPAVTRQTHSTPHSPGVTAAVASSPTRR